ADSFQIQLTTTNGDAGAANNNNADDNAVFKIDQGYHDYNGNSIVDIDGTNAVVPGYEQFVTVHQPLYNTGNTQGNYAQAIDATQLSDGLHYLSVVAFRKRNSNEDPLFREFRQVFYLDRTCPNIQITGPNNITTTTVTLNVKGLDRTLNNGIVQNNISKTVHFIANPPGNVDPTTLVNANNQATRSDRFQWSGLVTGLAHGSNRIAVCTFEESGRACSQFYNVFVDLCVADLDDGSGTGTP